MMTRIIAATILILLPPLAQAQAKRPPVTHKKALPASLKAAAARAGAAAVADPLLTAHPSSVSPEAREQAIQNAIARGVGSLAPEATASAAGGTARRGLKGSGWSANFSARRMQPRGFSARKADEPAPAPADAPPPYLYTPGALIRTEGLGYTATPTNDARWKTMDTGYAITQDPNLAFVVDPFPGPHIGPRDTPPPPTPGRLGSASGRNAITPNAVSFADSGSGGDSGEHNRDQGGRPDDPNRDHGKAE